MNVIQKAIFSAGCLLVTIHVLFPPRVYKSDTERQAPRAFIFSSDFYKTDVYLDAKQVGLITFTNSWNPVVLDQDRFWLPVIAGVLVTVALTAIFGKQPRDRN